MSSRTDPHPGLRPCHGDVWEQRPLREGSKSPRGRFSVMHVCGHHEPPHVTGYWHDGDDHPHPGLHDSIPFPRFVEQFHLIERESFDAA